MTQFKFFMVLMVTLGSAPLFAQESILTTNKRVISLSAIKGTTSRIDTLVITASKNLRITDIKIEGDQATYFRLLSPKAIKISPAAGTAVAFQFAPPAAFVGVARAKVLFRGIDLSVEIYGLSTKGLEGNNEPPLTHIVEALGLHVNVGWNTLANHLRPELQGEELPPSLFKKAGMGQVEMLPVARYSPDFLLNFGYYTQSIQGPLQHHTGILDTANRIPEHQTLFPTLAQGNTSFDPRENIFGFYAISPGHTLYSEDTWNMLFYPEQAAHAVRIFPLKDNSGNQVLNTYLLCMEEASNGDYNDYVFLVKNIMPIPLSDKSKSLFNGKNLDGWYVWLRDKGKNNDPDKIFTVSDGEIFDLGKDVGYIMTNDRYGNFHFTLEFKWGVKKWPPRENAKRDSGICYNIPEDETDKIWPRSIECQIQEGDVGDFWLLGYSTIQVDKKQNPPLPYSRIVKKKDAEKPTGEWNTVEVISFNGKCVHIVNGVVVHYGENASLIGGKILLQSEYAEVYYRNIRIREFQ
jgi:hypothetical protein